MPDQTRYALNSPDVAWEAFDDEVVIVNLQSGHYFSTRGTGAAIWRAVVAGATQPQIRELIVSAYEVDRQPLGECLQQFIESLLERALIVPAGEEPEAAAVQAPTVAQPAAKLAFTPPVLDTYSDMQDILLLDPIHEVDDKGWPHPR